MKPIYEPKGRAKEYCDLALNIYTGCNYNCTYCYAPRVLHKTKERFNQVEPRNNIVEATKKQLASGKLKNRIIQLCFTCDPYPAFIDTSVTHEIIKAIKDSGNHVQILTKGGERALRDLTLLDEHDWFGVSISGIGYEEPNAAPPIERLETLEIIKKIGIKTWVSCEPVINMETIYAVIEFYPYIDLYKIGKLNYMKSDIDWGEFGRECERLCNLHNRNYYIKEDLKTEMTMSQQSHNFVSN